MYFINIAMYLHYAAEHYSASQPELDQYAEYLEVLLPVVVVDMVHYYGVIFTCSFPHVKDSQ